MAIARALINEPEVLLLDEPLAALDANLRGRLADDIGDIVRATATPAIMVTHDHDEAATMGDTIVVIASAHLVGDREHRGMGVGDGETATGPAQHRHVIGHIAERPHRSRRDAQVGAIVCQSPVLAHPRWVDLR